MSDNWGGPSVPSRQAIEQVFLHFVTPPGYDCSKGWPRHLLGMETQFFLRIYDRTPLDPGSKEFRKARIGMVSDMLFKGVLAQEQAKGLVVSSEEIAEAQAALFPADDERWRLIPLTYTVKNIEWMGVQSWVGVEEHKLPLRLEIEDSGREVGKNIREGEDLDGTSRNDTKEDIETDWMENFGHGR